MDHKSEAERLLSEAATMRYTAEATTAFAARAGAHATLHLAEVLEAKAAD
jgi:hypothetical protein